MLKAADSVLGVSKLLVQIIKEKTGQKESEISQKIDNLIYLPLLKDKVDKLAVDNLSVYADELDRLKAINIDLHKIIPACVQDVRYAKVAFSDGESIYLDGRMYSVWPSTHIPYSFACSVNNVKNKIESFLNQNEELVFFNAPGYESLSADFFNFLFALENKGKKIVSVALYDHNLEKIASFSVPESLKRFVIFGVWAWQFTSSRRVKSIGEFRKFRIGAQNREFYIADIEIELVNSIAGQQVVFSGCALKAALTDKTRIVILSNFSSGAKTSEELALRYLDRWPNLEEAFGDYSRKIELFTYTANAGRALPVDNFHPPQEGMPSTKELLKNYLAILNNYVSVHFLSAVGEGLDILTTTERFYNLSVKIEKIDSKNCVAKFILPSVKSSCLLP